MYIPTMTTGATAPKFRVQFVDVEERRARECVCFSSINIDRANRLTTEKASVSVRD